MRDTSEAPRSVLLGLRVVVRECVHLLVLLDVLDLAGRSVIYPEAHGPSHVATHIRVSTDLLKHILIKVTRVAQQAPGNVVRVLKTTEDVINHRRLTPLSELRLRVLGVQVDVLHPAVMVCSMFLSHMLLEDNDVVVLDGLRVLCGVDRRRVLSDGAVEEHWGCRRQRGQRQTKESLHHGWLEGGMDWCTLLMVQGRCDAG